MKKLLLVLLFFVVAKYGHAQTFAPDGSYWRYCTTNPIWWTTTPSYFEIIGIDTIDGKEIKTIGGTAENHFDTGPLHFHTTGDSTFVYHPQDSSFNLIFNFSFQVGDTLRLTYKNSIWLPVLMAGFADSSDYIRMSVDSVGLVPVQGTSYRYYRMKMDTASSPSTNISSFSILEKMGMYDGHFILPVVFSGIWGGDYPQLFYYTNASVLNFQGDSTGVCVLGLDDALVWQGKIYPNPIVDFLYIENPYPETIYAKIIDMRGCLVRDNILLPAQNTVATDLTNLPAGVYLLQASLQSGKVLQRKIIKN